MRGALGGCVVLGASVFTACSGHYIRRGMDLYAEGRFVEAAEVFERTQERVIGSAPDQQAEYGLYRGANFLSLGDLEHAERWLSFSYGIERGHPGALSHEEQAFLDRSWLVLGDRMRGRQQLAPGTAVASTGPRAALDAARIPVTDAAEPVAPAR